MTASLAGAFAGLVMPILWSRFDNDSMSLVIAFLLVVALPAHAFVVGFIRSQTAAPRTLDTALLKRVGAWAGAAAISVLVVQAVRS